MTFDTREETVCTISAPEIGAVFVKTKHDLSSNNFFKICASFYFYDGLRISNKVMDDKHKRGREHINENRNEQINTLSTGNRKNQSHDDNWYLTVSYK